MSDLSRIKAHGCPPAGAKRIVGRANKLAMPFWAVFCILFWPISNQAAELLMFEQDGCPFCRKFDAEIAPDYPRSEAGQAAPLRRVDIFEDRRGGYDGLTPAVFTPTFVLVDDEGREVGRLEGYPGRRYFYPEIEPLIARLRRAPEASTIDKAGEDAEIASSPNENGAGRSPAPMK